MNNNVELIDDNYVFKCPHCDMFIQVHKDHINCRIFRHAVYKNTYQPINPHAPKQECDALLEGNHVYGCCKPFRLVFSNEIFVEACDYI